MKIENIIAGMNNHMVMPPFLDTGSAVQSIAPGGVRRIAQKG